MITPMANQWQTDGKSHSNNGLVIPECSIVIPECELGKTIEWVSYPYVATEGKLPPIGYRRVITGELQVREGHRPFSLRWKTRLLQKNITGNEKKAWTK